MSDGGHLEVGWQLRVALAAVALALAVVTLQAGAAPATLFLVGSGLLPLAGQGLAVTRSRQLGQPSLGLLYLLIGLLVLCLVLSVVLAVATVI